MPRRRSWLSSPFMSPPLLIILVPIIALMFLFFAVPSLLSVTSYILRPASVNKTRDSLNIFLVAFAILCGVFARRNDDESFPPDAETITAVTPLSDTYVKLTEEGGYTSHQWFGFSEERKIYDVFAIRLQSPAVGVSRLRRSSSSYPDLRQESSWETRTDPYKFRYLDDFEIDKFRSPAMDQLPSDHRKRWAGVEEEVNVKEIPVDTFEIHSSPPPKSPAPPPPPPPPPPQAAARHKPRRKYQTVPREEKVDNDSELTKLNDDEFTKVRSVPQTPPTPPPSPPPSLKMRSEHKHGKSERRKSNVKREIAMVWASVLSHQKKRKNKQRTKTSQNHAYDNVLHSSSELPNNTRAPPPPPPSVFHSLFKKGVGKSKKVHSVPTPPPPPPPPSLTSSKRWSKRKSQILSQTPPAAPPTPQPEPFRRKNAGRPPLPTKVSNVNDEAVKTGNQSPLIPILAPPPRFKLSGMKFEVRGEFCRIRSNHSSRCSSPEREDVDVPSTTEESETTTTTTNPVMDNGDRGGSVFCPSPDVNVKAATFIARLRREWKLEKLNSMKEKGNFGP